MDSSKHPYNIEDVCRMLSIDPQTKVCPVCGNKGAFGISIKKNCWNCFKCSNKGGDTELYAAVCNVDNSTAYKEIMKNIKGGIVLPPKIVATPSRYAESDGNLAKLSIRDKTYSKFYEVLCLDESHKADLLKRGFEQDELGPFLTLDLKTYEDRISFARKLMKLGCELKGIPGFYVDHNGNWTTAWTKRGILVPYRSFNNRIQGFQIRKDNGLLKVDKDGKKENKYTWLSSRSIPKDAKADSGTGSKTFIHYACDFERRTIDGVERTVPSVINGTIFLTEGGMKADLAHAITGQAYIAVPGVNALSELEKEFRRLRHIGITRIINAYDMDYVTNPNVQEAVGKTQNMIIDMGFAYNRLIWDAKELKGIDDFYAFHYRGIK